MEKERTENISEIRIYVACLASYNNGILHGRWIDATQGVDHIWDEIDQVIKTSPTKGAEEHAIHDYEGFEDIRISEYLDIDTVCEISKFIQEHGELGSALYCELNDIDDCKAYLTDNYQGQYSSLANYAQELTEETTQILGSGPINLWIPKRADL